MLTKRLDTLDVPGDGESRFMRMMEFTENKDEDTC